MDTGNYLNAGGIGLQRKMSSKPQDSESTGKSHAASGGGGDSFSERAGSVMDEIKETGRGIKAWIQKNIIGEEADYKTRCRMGKMVGIGAAGGGAAGAAAGFVYGLVNENSNKVSEAWKTHEVDDPVKLLGFSHQDIEDGHTESHTYYVLDSVSHTEYDSDGHSYTYYTTETRAVTYYTYEHDGYWHRNMPNIDWRKVGEYKTPYLVREHAIGPIEGAAIGLGVGIVMGTVIGAITAHIHKIITQTKEDGAQ
jgi:hypothetical protein